MSGSLDQLLEDGVIDEVLARLKSGKEADVWLVRHHADVLAAKIYKERSTRSFKNSSGYKEGRAVRNTRTQRAMDRGSRFGQEAAEEEWKSAEADALHKLHAASVRVPTPVLFYEGVLLMELVVDEEGRPAPRLIDALVPPESAAELYADLRAQAVRMLCCDLIHGDLSPYNVLLGAAGPTIIDFPQVVSAAQNSRAQEFFTRDIENLRDFFAAADPAIAARKSDAAEIWQAYVRRDLSPDYVPTGKWVPPQERRQSAPRPPPADRGGPRDHGPSQRHSGPQGHGGSRGHGGAPGPGGAQGQGAPQPGAAKHGRGQGRGSPGPRAPQQGDERRPHPGGQPRAGQQEQHRSGPRNPEQRERDPQRAHQPQRPHANPQGQHHAPRPHANPQGQHRAPRPHANPQGQHHAPRPNANPQGQPHAPRPHANPPGQHPRPPRPHDPRAPRGGAPRGGPQRSQPQARPAPIVERIERPVLPKPPAGED